MLSRTSRSSLPIAAALACLFAGVFINTAEGVEVSATQVAERTQKVLKHIPWAESLNAAKEKAAQEKKLVFWMQLVGDLDGGL